MTDDHGPVGLDDASVAELRAELTAARVEADQLRAQSRLQAAVLRRPLVRIGRRLDREASRLERTARRGTDRLRAANDRVGLAAGALGVRADLDERAAVLRRVVAELPDAPAAAAAAASSRSVSVVLVADSPTPTAPRIGTDRDPVLEVLVAHDPRDPSAAARRAAARTSGELIAFLPAEVEPLDPSWLARLAGAVHGRTVAAVPQCVHPRRSGSRATAFDLLVRSLGIDVADDPEHGPRPMARAAGTAVDAGTPPTAVAAGGGGGLLVDRAAYTAVGGLADGGPLDAALIDLCARLRSAGGTITTVPSSLLFDHRPVARRAELVEPIDRRSPAWRKVVETNGPALTRPVTGGSAGRGLRVAITVAAPTARVAPQWGDWHLAEGLTRSLRALGVEVDLHPLDGADALTTRAADVHLVLRGQAPVRRTPGQTHILWIISHPESIETAELDEADLVLVASERYAAHLAGRTRTPVEVLLQATDPRRFRPLPSDPAHAHPVAIVATTRHVLRRSVADAIAVGLRPAIYGSGWHQFVDPELIVADFIPNEHLPAVYSSVDVLLNDHWDTMRSWGFVSNRIFDALACGTPVISDHLPELAGLVGDAVVTYADRDELRTRVDEILADPAAARRRAAIGRQRVLDAHTFDHRAATLLAALDRHDLAGVR